MGEDKLLPEELLDIMLHEAVQGLPAKRLCQLLCSNWLVVELQLVEHPLQGKSNRLLAVVRLSGHLVHCLAQQVGEVQHLKEGVHVASGTLVLEAHVACVLLAVPRDPVWSIGVDLHFKDHTVVLDVAFLGVLHLVPAQIVTEAPIVLLGVEEMGDLPGELGAVPLVNQPQVSSRVAAPCRRLGFTIALRLVSFKFCCLV